MITLKEIQMSFSMKNFNKTKRNLKKIIRDRWHDFRSTMCFNKDHRIYDEQSNGYR